MSLLFPLYFRLKAPLNQDLLLSEYRALKIAQHPWYLVSVAGQQSDDYALSGILAATPDLARCPYIQNILADFDFPIARVWFNEKIDESNTDLHSCEYQAWMYVRVLLHVSKKIDLVVEIERRYLETLQERGLSLMHKHCLSLLGGGFNVIEVMAFDNLLLPIRLACAALEIDPEKKTSLQNALETSFQAWKKAFKEFKQSTNGELIYRRILLELEQSLRHIRKQLPETAHCALKILSSSLDMCPAVPQRMNRQLIHHRQIKREQANIEINTPTFERPVFIVSAPRAGSTLLFNSLAVLPDLWTTGEENHRALEKINGLHPKDQAYRSNCLDAHVANFEIKTAVEQLFSRRLLQGERVYAELSENQRPETVRLLEKTPKNALRIPFLKALFPDAQFIYLYREPKGNISSLIEGWRSRRFIAYSDLPNWRAKDWQFLLIPDWETLDGKALLDVCSNQWAIANETIIQDLHNIDRQDWCMLSYSDFIAQPVRELQALAKFMNIAWSPALEQFAETLPLTAVTLSQPSPEKWRKYAHDLQRFRGKIQSVERAWARLRGESS